MTEILAVFRSRSQAVDAVYKLRAAGVAATAVNTPKEANVGCGLSVKFSQAALPRAKAIIARGGYSSFMGYICVYTTGSGKFYKKL